MFFLSPKNPPILSDLLSSYDDDYDDDDDESKRIKTRKIKKSRRMPDECQHC